MTENGLLFDKENVNNVDCVDSTIITNKMACSISELVFTVLKCKN